MTTTEVIAALRGMKVQTGSLICFGCGHEHNCGIHGCAVILAAIQELEAKVPRWIPVTERLPKLEEPVLVLDRRGNKMVRTLRCLATEEAPSFRPDGLVPQKHITHWMLLPEAPEEGGNESATD